MPVGPVSIFSRPRRWAGEPPSGRFFLAISRSLFESDNLKEVGENYFEATPRFLCCRAARICTQINFPPPGSHSDLGKCTWKHPDRRSSCRQAVFDSLYGDFTKNRENKHKPGMWPEMGRVKRGHPGATSTATTNQPHKAAGARAVAVQRSGVPLRSARLSCGLSYSRHSWEQKSGGS